MKSRAANISSFLLLNKKECFYAPTRSCPTTINSKNHVKCRCRFKCDAINVALIVNK